MRFHPAIFMVVGLLVLEAHLLAKNAPEGRQRVLVISTPSKADPRFRKQQSLLTPSSTAFRERDLIVKIASGEFQIKLIGKDGHVAFSSREPVTQGEIFARIDAMPMRRDEMQRRQQHRKAD